MVVREGSEYIRLTLLALLILEEFEALKGGSTGDHFVGELSLVLVAAISVDFLVSIFRFTWVPVRLRVRASVLATKSCLPQPKGILVRI